MNIEHKSIHRNHTYSHFFSLFFNNFVNLAQQFTFKLGNYNHTLYVSKWNYWIKKKINVTPEIGSDKLNQIKSHSIISNIFQRYITCGEYNSEYFWSLHWQYLHQIRNKLNFKLFGFIVSYYFYFISNNLIHLQFSYVFRRKNRKS